MTYTISFELVSRLLTAFLMISIIPFSMVIAVRSIGTIKAVGITLAALVLAVVFALSAGAQDCLDREDWPCDCAEYLKRTADWYDHNSLIMPGAQHALIWEEPSDYVKDNPTDGVLEHMWRCVEHVIEIEMRSGTRHPVVILTLLNGERLAVDYDLVMRMQDGQDGLDLEEMAVASEVSWTIDYDD